MFYLLASGADDARPGVRLTAELGLRLKLWLPGFRPGPKETCSSEPGNGSCIEHDADIRAESRTGSRA
jgi:hypothetical protein